MYRPYKIRYHLKIDQKSCYSSFIMFNYPLKEANNQQFLFTHSIYAWKNKKLKNSEPDSRVLHLSKKLNF